MLISRHKGLLRKQKGEATVSGAAMLALTVLCMFVLLNILHGYYKTLYAEEEIHTAARTYLLKTELVGYLEQNDVDELVARLSELGMTEIKLSGNFAPSVSSSVIRQNLYARGYGESVSITIEGVLNNQNKIINFLGTNLNIGEPRVNVNITKKGVCVK